MPDIALNVFSPYLLGQEAMGNISDMLSGYRRSLRLLGGCWIMSFRVTGHINDLKQIFHEWLGYHVEESTRGLKTWAGMFYSMDLAYKGDIRRKSLEELFNKVRTAYVNENNKPLESSWASTQKSIDRYGEKQDILQLNGYPQAAAEAMRDTWLRECAWPYARPVGFDQTSISPYLDVKVCGYSYTTNWKYVTSEDGATGNISTWVSSIATTDCQFVSVGKIETNTLQVKRKQKTKMRAWDKLIELTDLGETASAPRPYRVWVDQERKLHYGPIEASPRYYWRGGKLYLTNNEEVIPWLVIPGVVRDFDYPVDRAEPSAPFLEDARDALITEVEAGNGRLYLKTDLFRESEILSAQEEYRRMLEDEQKEKGKTKKRHPWSGTGYTAKEWERLTPEQRRRARAKANE